MATALKPKPAPVAPASTPERLPLLLNGDRLTRAEFERRYVAMPEVKKAELIDGIVYMGSPVRHSLHAAPHARIIIWLGQYEAATPGTDIGDNATVRLDLENEVQPDVFLRRLPSHGGRTTDTPDGYLSGGPEFVAEVAASSAAYDLHQKKAVFRRHGVPEYLVWITGDGGEAEVRWFVLENDEYVLLAPGDDGLLRSRIFPGLWLDPAALLAGDHARVRAVLEEGLASDEHAAFVRELGGEGA